MPASSMELRANASQVEVERGAEPVEGLVDGEVAGGRLVLAAHAARRAAVSPSASEIVRSGAGRRLGDERAGRLRSTCRIARADRPVLARHAASVARAASAARGQVGSCAAAIRASRYGGTIACIMLRG